MHRHAGRLEFLAQPRLETDREFRLHRGACISEPRQSHEQSLDSAVKIARRNVQHAYQLAASASDS